jgi:ssDNA-binding Zn-finger/Zn-ribbon topoisomerase 1
MVCYHRNKLTQYCSIKKRVVNPEELYICENCNDFKKFSKSEHVSCDNCGVNFSKRKNAKIEIKTVETMVCPNCKKVIGIRTDDKSLNR